MNFVKQLVFLPLWRASLLRPAPFESPQGGNAARVEGCSGAIRGACPFFLLPHSPEGGHEILQGLHLIIT